MLVDILLFFWLNSEFLIANSIFLFSKSSRKTDETTEFGAHNFLKKLPFPA